MFIQSFVDWLPQTRSQRAKRVVIRYRAGLLSGGNNADSLYILEKQHHASAWRYDECMY